MSFESQNFPSTRGSGTFPRRGMIRIQNQTPRVQLSEIPVTVSKQRRIRPIHTSPEGGQKSHEQSEEWPGLEAGPPIVSKSTGNKAPLKPVTRELSSHNATRNHESSVSETRMSGGLRVGKDVAANTDKSAEMTSYVSKLKAPAKPKVKTSSPSPQPSIEKNWRDQRTNAKKGELKAKLNKNFKEKLFETECGNAQPHTKRDSPSEPGFETHAVVTESCQPRVKKEVLTAVSKDVKRECEGSGTGEKVILNKDEVTAEAARAKRKARRAKIRERKKIENEQEKLKNIRAPKDSKVTVLSGKALTAYLKSVSTIKVPVTRKLDTTLDDFPNLAPSRSNRWVEGQAMTLAEIVRLPKPAPSQGQPSDASAKREATPTGGPCEADRPVVEERKAPKPKDPIEFNLFDIAMAKSVMKKRNRDQRSALQNSRNRKIVDNDKIVVNTLDATAPVLSRGKIRTRAKKPTLMKKAILKQRQERQKLLSVSAGMVAASPRVPETLQAVGNADEAEWEDQPSAIAMPGNVVVVEKAKRTKKQKKEKKLDPECNLPVSHNRKFREYCDQMLTDDIDHVCVDLLHDLVRFQDRAHQKDPIKAKMRKRLVFGLREVTRQVERGRVKSVIVAPNLEKCDEPGGLDDAVKTLLTRVHEKNVFCVYALDRWRLSRATKKRGMTSCVGIFNHQGSDENYKKLADLASEARDEYARRRIVKTEEETTTGQQVEKAEIQMEVKSEPGVYGTLMSLLKIEITD